MWMFKTYKTELTVEDRLVGRLLAKPVHLPDDDIQISENTEIDNTFLNKLNKSLIIELIVRSPLTCESLRSVVEIVMVGIYLIQKLNHNEMHKVIFYTIKIKI